MPKGLNTIAISTTRKTWYSLNDLYSAVALSDNERNNDNFSHRRLCVNIFQNYIFNNFSLSNPKEVNKLTKCCYMANTYDL